MSRQKRLYCSLLTAYCLLLIGVSPAAARLPNVVVIFTDDQGYGDVGVFGARDFATPHLDRMAQEGVRLTDFYAAQAVCSASRAALLTGCYPNRIGIHGALGPQSRHGIGAGEVTIAELLKARGYQTAVFGKWHLGHHPQFLPTRHGFDEYFGLPYSNDMWPQHPEAAPGTYPALPLIEGNQSGVERVVQLMPDQTRLTKWYTERALHFIARNKSRPFFLYLPHTMPHVPLHAGARFKSDSPQGLYGDVIREIDWSVGEVLAAIKKHKLDRDTLVIFASDNGPWLSYGGHAGSTGGLREGKGTVWEGGTRVPFIARWPGKIPAGLVNREPAMTIDLLPTIARLVGGALPQHKIDGLDIWPLLAGRPGAKSPHETFFFYYNVNELQAARGGRWKLILPHNYRTLAGRQGRNDGVPIKYQTAKAGLELYDLEQDVGETKNVAGDHPDVVKRLEALVEQAREDMGDQLTGRTGRNVRAAGRLVEAK